MVGIVVVAHSSQLAEAAVELSRLMLRQATPIVAAGGTGDPESPFGTSALQIQEAIEKVYSDDGVIVLMDMGSAILSAETALEFLTSGQRDRVLLCEAPLVEGAIAAAVRAEAGGSLEEVAAEAREALAGKAAQLGITPQQPLTRQTEPGKPELPDDAAAPAHEEVRLAVSNPSGIHARPAAKLVSTAAGFKSEITVRNLNRDTAPADARSINSLAALGVRQGHEILVSAAGPDAGEALAAIRSLVERGFDETTGESGELPSVEAEKGRAAEGPGEGIPVAPGIAIGPLVHYAPVTQEITEDRAGSPEAEWERVREAIDSVRRETGATRDEVCRRSGEYAAAIFDAHLLCLEDPSLLKSVRQKITAGEVAAEKAWAASLDEVISRYQALDDAYLRERSADLEDLKSRVLQQLAGNRTRPFSPSVPSVLAAADLKPSEISSLDPANLLAICTARGTLNSHSAILAKALGIPVVFGLGESILNLPEGAEIAVDGNTGRVLVRPKNRNFYVKQQRAWKNSQKEAQKASRKPALTIDGKQIAVLANIGSRIEAGRAVLSGAEGIGLLRTEFLFFDRPEAPSEEEQYDYYQNIARAAGRYPVTIRTLDAGGDKRLPYLGQAAEENPFLGERGIRLCLNHPEIFKTQLKAILRVSREHKIRVMLPMISSLAELRQAKLHLAEAQEELGPDMSPGLSPECGIMIETPAAAMMAEFLAREADFFSIGTNDLCQYVMAADRNNSRVSDRSDALHPAVLRLMRQTILAAHHGGIPVGVCGEVAGQTAAVPIMVGLGIDYLSLNLTAIAGIKQAISQITLRKAEYLASRALEMESAEEVRKLLAGASGQA